MGSRGRRLRSGLTRMVDAEQRTSQRLRASRLALFPVSATLIGTLISACVPDGGRTGGPLHPAENPPTATNAPPRLPARSRIVKDDDGAARRSERTSEPSGAEHAEDRTAILALVPAFSNVWNKHDAKALASASPSMRRSAARPAALRRGVAPSRSSSRRNRAHQ